MEILKTPWWVSTALAIIVYITLKYIAPDFFEPRISNFLSFLAPIITMGLFLHSAAMLYEGEPVSEDTELESDSEKDSPE